ncbi:uncharacterized [Tachysurus ichikawai]
MIIGCSSVCKIYSRVLNNNDNARILNLAFNPPLATGHVLTQWEVGVRVAKMEDGEEGSEFRTSPEHEAALMEDGGWKKGVGGLQMAVAPASHGCCRVPREPPPRQL